MSRGNHLLTFMGPQGSFTHAAVDLLDTPWTGPVQARASVADVIFSVESGEAQAGIVPLETSVEGDVSSTVDELIFRSSICFIQEEVVVPVNYVVAGAARARIEDVTTLFATSTAVRQCSRLIESSGARVRLVESAARACAEVERAQDPTVAAVATARSARVQGLTILRGNAEDHSGTFTRMALLGRRLRGPTGHDRTSVVITPTGDRTGVLGEILTAFSDRDIALTAISSRALRTRRGEFSFLFTARGHLADERLQAALTAAAAVPADIKVLGSYPILPEAQRPRGREAAPPGSVNSSTLGPWLDSLLSTFPGR